MDKQALNNVDPYKRMIFLWLALILLVAAGAVAGAVAGAFALGFVNGERANDVERAAAYGVEMQGAKDDLDTAYCVEMQGAKDDLERTGAREASSGVGSEMKRQHC